MWTILLSNVHFITYKFTIKRIISQRDSKVFVSGSSFGFEYPASISLWYKKQLWARDSLQVFIFSNVIFLINAQIAYYITTLRVYNCLRDSSRGEQTENRFCQLLLNSHCNVTWQVNLEGYRKSSPFQNLPE